MSNNYTWNERYRSDKYGLEQKSSYNYFREYLKESKPRNLKEFHDKLSDKLSAENPNKKIPTYKSIRDYSHKWKWNKRAEAYDNYIDNTEDEELKSLFKEIKRNSLQNLKNRINYQNNMLVEIQNDNTLTAKDKIYASARNSEAYNNEIRSINEVYNEGKEIKEVDADVNTNSIVEVERKSVFEEIKELDTELNSIYEDGKDTEG